MSEAAAPNLAQSRWRLACTIGAATMVSFALAVSATAYRGKLPASLPQTEGLDKVGHFLIFGAVAFFADGALRYRRLTRRTPWMRLAPVLVWLPVAIDEWAQRFSPHRSSELADLVADTLGIALGAWLSFAIDRWLGRRAARS
jgi:VanZ family protein